VGIEMTEQKEREKSENRDWPRYGGPPHYGTGHGVWRLRQREKKEKKIKGIKRRRGGREIGPGGRRSRDIGAREGWIDYCKYSGYKTQQGEEDH